MNAHDISGYLTLWAFLVALWGIGYGPGLRQECFATSAVALFAAGLAWWLL